MLAAGLLLLAVLPALHCDMGPISPPPSDEDDDSSLDADTDTDADGDADADTDTGAPVCTDETDQYPGDYHCSYAMLGSGVGCYEYAQGISRAEAEADCRAHLQGGPGGRQTHDGLLGEGPCDLDTSGYCFTGNQSPCGREHTASGVSWPGDCKPVLAGSSAWMCEIMGHGAYTCNADIDAGVDAGR